MLGQIRPIADPQFVNFDVTSTTITRLAIMYPDSVGLDGTSAHIIGLGPLERYGCFGRRNIIWFVDVDRCETDHKDTRV